MTSASRAARAVRPFNCSRIFALLILTLAAMPAAAWASWHWQNPLPEPYTLRSIAFENANTVAAAGDQGTIIMTADGGQTWTVRPTGIPLEGNFSRIRYLDATTLVAVGANIQSLGIGDGFVVRSTDGGVTWATTATLPNLPLADVEFVDAQHGTAVGIDYATFAPAILRTTDGGQTWTTQELPGMFGLLDAVHFIDATTGYTVGFDLAAGSALIVKTTDGGATWQRQSSSSAQQLNDVAFSDATTGFAVGNAGTILATTDGGTNWTAQTSGTTLDMHRIVLTGAASAAIAGGDSANHGVVLSTGNGGASWTAQSFGSSIEGIAFLDANTGGAVGAAGVIFRTTDGGANWMPQQRSVTPNALQAVAFVDPLAGVAVGSAGTIVRTTDGGNNWIAAQSATSLVLYGISMGDAALGVAVGGDITSGDRVILATADGGATWADVTPTDLPQVPLMAVSCPASGVCTAVGYCGMIIGTADGGATWTTERAASCTDQLTLQAVDFFDPNHGTAVGQNTILHTTDGGATWTQQTSPTSQVLRGVRFADPSDGFIVGGHVQNQATILHTTDGGATWVVQVNNIATNVQAVDVTDSEHAIAVTLDGTIYSTSDAGANWNIEQRVSGNLYGIATVDAQTARAVGAAHGNGAIIAKNDAATFSMSLDPIDAAVCAPGSGTSTTTVNVAIGSIDQYSGTVALSSDGTPSGITSVFAPPVVAAPGTSGWTLTATTGVTPGSYVVTATGDDGEQTQHANLQLAVIDPTIPPSPTTPANGAVGVDLLPTFAWTADANVTAFRLQVATDAAFSEIALDVSVTGTTFTSGTALAPATPYFWRVQGTRGCAGAWSATFSFTTRANPIAQLAPSSLSFEVPAGPTGTNSATLAISNEGVGDLVWSIDAAALSGAGAIRSAPEAPRAATHGTAHAADLAKKLGAPLPGLTPIVRAAGGINCDGAQGVIVHDDGSIENAYSGNPTGISEVMFVDRFVPDAYPATFDSVCVALLSTGPSSLDFDIVLYDDTGPNGSPGAELGELPAHADGIPSPETNPVWFGVDVSSLGISIGSGSVYIGLRWSPADPGVFIASDESPGHPVDYAGGYWWNDADATWASLPDAFSNYRALFVRAAVAPSGCEDPSSVPWLSVNPASGSTPAGTTSDVQVTVDGAGLPAGDYSATLCFRSNDLTRPLIVVPITMTVVPGEPASMTVLGGSGQSAAVGTAFATPLSVQVRDGLGNPVLNVTVNFAAPASGASATLSATSVETDANGYAAVTAIANATAGSYSVTATVDGIATPATFALTNTAAVGDLAVAIVADRAFVRAGETIDYIVTVGNYGPNAIHGATISTAMSSLLDAGAATWFCTGAAGACAPEGIGDIADSNLDLAPGANLTYVLTAPVRLDADGTIETNASGTAPGDPNNANNSATAANAIVLFRDGFEPYGDGELDAVDGTVGEGAAMTFAWPARSPLATSPITPVLVARPLDGGAQSDDLRIEQVSVGTSSWARIVAVGAKAEQRRSAWLPVVAGTRAVVALVEDPDLKNPDGAAPSQCTVVIDIAGREIVLPVALPAADYRVWSSAPTAIAPMR